MTFILMGEKGKLALKQFGSEGVEVKSRFNIPVFAFKPKKKL